ncbi:rhodanese domain-containing protein CG4456-like isoform X1 [Sabethes cyaneus]|uniref:rhodanese domain-containing protein CG4456-like isoform X1 n=1 Tax=Sabethes cyaneus TaxID=53552 RepID=UPI00237EBC43|nr:rhodanese domain-containing protein CG4456-like isoform X1 [Sabethes cyaneus]XP_053684045.1 rhodanese domain-containing protein CG4456-like isoform X1 [Sabethes cyaneus]
MIAGGGLAGFRRRLLPLLRVEQAGSRAVVQNFTKVNRYSCLANQLPVVSYFAQQNLKKLQVSPNAPTGGLRFCSADCATNKFDKNCIDPSLVATYDEIVDLPNHPEKLLIDVRERQELADTGVIPTSINIPLKTVTEELKLSPDAFEAKYGRKKPAVNDPVIFSCRSGVRAGEAANQADKLGFKNVKNYVGSWLEYAQKNNLPLEPSQ